MVTAFWLLTALVFDVYVGYPLLVHVWALSIRSTRPERSRGEPSVSFVIASRNEARRIPGRIDNLRQLDYPSSKQQIIVVSDGSTDETADVLARFPHVTGIEVPAGGKACALNAGVARATNDILVFADMRQGFAPDALRALVAPFRDSRVGAVSGELVLDGETRDRRHDDDRRAPRDRRSVDDPREDTWGTSGQRKASRRWSGRRARFESTVTDGVGLYWRYEKQI